MVSQLNHHNELNEEKEFHQRDSTMAQGDEKNYNMIRKKYGTDHNYHFQIVWKNAIGFLILHILGLYGFYLCYKRAKILTFFFAVLSILVASQGLIAGAHRMWSHKSFKARLPLKIFLLILFTFSGQNCLWVWVRDHRLHHRYSDTDADPHNATRGFFFSHMGWLMVKKHPLVIELGRTIDMSDLEADPFVMFQKKYYKTLYFIFGFLIPIAVPVLVWNEDLWVSIFVSYFGRYVYGLNSTWCLNSLGHMLGQKPYNKNMLPVDSLLLNFFVLGEGSHNFHHTFPWDCRAGERTGIYNMPGAFINFMERIGQAYDLKKTSPEMIRNRMLKTGDGTIICDNINLKTVLRHQQ